MKKIILSLALVTGLTTLSKAQEAAQTAPVSKKESKKEQTPEERSKSAANWAEKKLGLNAEQKSQWEVAALKRSMVNQRLHDRLKGTTTPDERKIIHEEIKGNVDAFDGTVNAFLTPEQKTKFEAIKKQKHEAHQAKIKSGKATADSVDDNIEG
ncbi:MAG: hypothetical protein H0U95_13090 [Bacteroidetes bacterium]|nr:hypothetical protein [Bacteroidota bacterium]